MNGYYKLVTSFTVCNTRRMIYDYYGLYPDSNWGSEKLSTFVASSPATTRSPSSSYSTSWGWGYGVTEDEIEPDCLCDSRYLANVGHEGGCKWLKWKQSKK